MKDRNGTSFSRYHDKNASKRKKSLTFNYRHLPFNHVIPILRMQFGCSLVYRLLVQIKSFRPMVNVAGNQEPVYNPAPDLTL